jgi:hypothetical protein
MKPELLDGVSSTTFFSGGLNPKDQISRRGLEKFVQVGANYGIKT